MAIPSVITDLSATAASNYPDGSEAPSVLDNVQRVHAGFIRNLLDATQSNAYTAFTTGGTSTAYTLTPSPAITAYAAGQAFEVTFNAACGAAPTLAISGVATPPNLVKQLGNGTYGNLSAGDVTLNHRSRVTLLSATQALVEKLPFGAESIIANGYQKLPSGLIVQWGATTSVGTAAGNATITYPIAFPAGALIGMANIVSGGISGTFTAQVTTGSSLTTLTITTVSGTTITSGIGAYWVALGY